MADRDELTLDEAFSDPLIQAVMTADKVDRAQLRREWASLIAEPGSRSAADPSPQGAPRSRAGGVPAGWDALVRDCLCAALTEPREGSRRTGTR